VIGQSPSVERDDPRPDFVRCSCAQSLELFGREARIAAVDAGERKEAGHRQGGFPIRNEEFLPGGWPQLDTSLYAVMNHTMADAIPSPKAPGRSLIVTADNVEGGSASPSWAIPLRHFDRGVIDTPVDIRR
jgi:hypothetical protein